MAPPLRIVFDEWTTDSARVGLARIPLFTVFRGGDYLFQSAVRLRVSFAEQLLEGNYREEAERARLEGALLRFAVKRIERGLAAGSFTSEPASDIQTLTVEEGDIFELAGLLAGKTCDYQVRQGRDLYCSAASPNDGTATKVYDDRAIAPTSRQICQSCDLPNTDSICSYLVHPAVTALQPAGVVRHRFVADVLCDRGRPEISEPTRCRAGGHDCWERIVEPVEAPTEPTMSPLSLPEQLDFLDAVWQVAFKRPLLHLGPATHVAGLALGSTTREEFTARLTDLADVLGSLDVPADLLPPDRSSDRGALKRVELALSGTDLDQDGKDRVVVAVMILRSVVRIRVGLQHGDAAKELPEHFGKLQISYPPSDWETAWNQVRARTVDSLVQLRDEVRRLADGAG